VGIASAARARLTRGLSGGLLVVWAVAMTAISVVLLARHAIALPTPTPKDARFQAAVAQLAAGDAQQGWSAVHVLYAKCRCSQRIVDHLVDSRRPAGVRERVLLVDDDGAFTTRLRAAGFTVIATAPTELRDKYRVEAAPLFVVSAPDGRIRYAGGYTREKQGPDIRDLAILSDLMADRTPEVLPTLGCAVSDELRAVLNPLEIN
jgi:hypothetical protein